MTFATKKFKTSSSAPVQKRGQKPLIIRRGKRMSINQMLNMFTISPKNPKVKNLRGKTRRLRRGLMNWLINPKTIPAERITFIFSFKPSSIFTPGIKRIAREKVRSPIIILKKNFLINKINKNKYKKWKEN